MVKEFFLPVFDLNPTLVMLVLSIVKASGCNIGVVGCAQIRHHRQNVSHYISTMLIRG